VNAEINIPDDAQLLLLARLAGAALVAVGWRVALAESCTGGWVGKSLTDIAGSSDFFSAGFTTYSNDSKIFVLGVPSQLIAERGAVSAEVVMAMARGALRVGQADIALATSGIAGPTGGSDDKPVGLVWFGLAASGAAGGGAGGRVRSDRQQFGGDRDEVRRQSVAHALRLISAAASAFRPLNRG
jgi:nicotinamide-nucleotide amidase